MPSDYFHQYARSLRLNIVRQNIPQCYTYIQSYYMELRQQYFKKKQNE